MIAIRNLACVTLMTLVGGIAGAQEVTHLGVPAGRLVSLTYKIDNGGSPCQDNRSFFRRNASARIQSEPFVVPGGKNLIITDITWQGDDAPNESFFASSPPRFQLWVHEKSGALINLLYEGAPIPLADNVTGNIGGQESIFSGIRVAAGRLLCPDLSGRRIEGSDEAFTDHTVVIAEMFGYLVNIK